MSVEVGTWCPHITWDYAYGGYRFLPETAEVNLWVRPSTQTCPVPECRAPRPADALTYLPCPSCGHYGVLPQRSFHTP